MEHSKNFCSKQGFYWLEVELLRETSESLLTATVVSCETGEDFLKERICYYHCIKQ